MKLIEVKNLNVIFGNKEEQKNALALIESNKSPVEIKEITNATVANRNISLDIMKNELFVIVGLSGSGKSTFVRTLNLLNKPSSGEILVEGKDITKFNKEELRNYRRNDISMVFQNFGLLSHRNIIRNVEYSLEIQGVPKKEREEIALEAIETVGLKGWEESMPNELSGGMQQRVGLARAIANNPKILLMDEPYSALDPLIRKEMQEDLLQIGDDVERTIIFITHDMTEAFKLGDRIVLMKDGEVVQIGTPNDFFNNPANDYVKEFIEDVDKTRILRVRNIMRPIHNLFNINGNLEEALSSMKEKEIEDLFVTNDDGVLLGYLNKEVILKNKNKNLKELLNTDITHHLRRNMYLTDVWHLLNESNIDVPVLDRRGRLRGVLGYDDVFEAMSK